MALFDTQNGSVRVELDVNVVRLTVTNEITLSAALLVLTGEDARIIGHYLADQGDKADSADTSGV